MSNTADSSPSINATLEEESDVIELTEEVGASSPASSPDDDLDLLIPKFRLPSGQATPVDEDEAEAEPVVEPENAAEEAAAQPAPAEPTPASEEKFDREELVRTVKMEAFDRSQIELLDSVRKWDVKGFIEDQRFAPDILVLPPRVLTRKWAEGPPAMAPGANAGASRPDDRSSLAKTVQSTAVAPEGDVPKVIVEEPGLSETSDVESLDLDSEALEHVPTPPPKPAAPPKSTPPSQPPAAKQAPVRKRRETRPIPKGPQQPQPARKQGGGDDDMSGIVQELLEEKKPKKQLSPAEMKRQNWFIDVFNDEYLRTLSKDMKQQTEKEVKFIVESLGVKKGARIFDLACGFGRHAVDLAKQGYEVAGLDLSMPLLQRALNEAQRRSLSIKFIHGDMRELNFNEIFDAAYCWQTSFGYFDDKTNFKVLQGVHRALKPGGRFLLDLVNRDYVVAEMPSRTWWEGVECVFLEEVEFDYDASILHTKRSFIYEDGSPPQEFSSYIRLYGLHELRQILKIAGFEVLEVSGELLHPGSFLGASSSKLMILAEKR